MKKVLIFSKIPIAPAFGGNRQRILTFVNELVNLSFDVHFALIPSRQMRDADLDAHREIVGKSNLWIIARGAIGNMRFNLKALTRRALSRLKKSPKSNNVDYLFDRSITGECRKIINIVKPDVVIVEYVHFSSIFELVGPGTIKVLDTHDSFANEFEVNAEAIGLRRADLVIAIQDKEEELFNSMLKDSNTSTKVSVISHIIGQKRPIDLSSCTGATFLGSNFEANNDSLAALISNVMPLVLQQRPNFILNIIGAVGDSVPDYPFVIKHGRVDMISSALKQAPVLANYITKGTGIKIKLLDAMAMGVPCVSTRLGAEGVKSEFAGGVIVADSNQQFADELISLFDHQDRREQIGKAGYDAAAQWDAVQRHSLKRAMGII
jgi:glycosyltransferase involved in cell wall biosynthesis